MIKRVCLSLFVPLISVYAGNVSVVENSFDYKYLNISKSDTSRIWCENGNIGKFVYGQDKEIVVEKIDNNLFVRLSPVVVETSDGRIISTTVNDFSRDLYIECGGQMYSLILNPKDISAQTIILKNTKDTIVSNNKQGAKKFETSKDYETTLLELVKSSYLEKAPDGYDIKYIDKLYAEYQELSLFHIKSYIGNKLQIDEFIIKAKDDLSLNEKMFIDIINNPLAISVSKLNIPAFDTARLFIVSNLDADRTTYQENINQFSKTLEEYEKKSAEKSNSEKVFIRQEILDFVGGNEK